MRVLLSYGLVLALLLLTVDAEGARKRRKSRRRAKGTIQLITVTEGASAYLDGKLWGKTPLRPLKITPGNYRISVKKLGHLEYSATIEVERRKTTKVRAQLLPFAGVLNVRASLPGAKVYVDGLDRGAVPSRFELDVGSHEVVVKADGKEFRQEVSAMAGEEIEVTATFSTTSTDDGGLALAPIDGTSGAEDEMDLELVPPTQTSDADESLALVPPDPAAGNDGELALVAPSTSDDELALAPVDGLELDAPAIAVAPSDPLQPGSVGTSVGDRKSWYEEWWVWTAGGATLVAVVATSLALRDGGANADTYTPDVSVVLDGQDEIGPKPAAP